MATFFADVGRNLREYATVEIEADSADQAAILLRDALKADKAGDYPELLSDLNWRVGEVTGDIDLIDGLQDEDGEAVETEIEIEGAADGN